VSAVVDGTTRVAVLTSIQELAPIVAASHAELDAAIDLERAAEAALLERAISVAKPALRALAKRIVRSSYKTAGRNGCDYVARTEYHDEIGVCLDDRYDRETDSAGDRGSFCGTRLYLLRDGRLAETERTGSWSQWQGAADEWETTIRILTPRDVMDRAYELYACLSALRDALAKHAAGSAGKRSKAARARAERLSALVTLVTS
jgi:hypothetical protein